eukprot:TRINITY_DN1123_c0_g1_i1.p1 TRINITY_DN1123_c0_g1~~TRINITY_DN1123_c0_g1_i1.p1  ORF type:complete len:499 (-),score=172.11 TRINITY_DN1123_c0_g1_i1:61-1440(-)
MVMQRAPQQANVWGWDSPGNSVSISFLSYQDQVTVGENGEWSFTLPATQAGGPFNISLKSSSEQTIVLKNILFGDVWLCGGQSNMQFTVSQGFNATEEIASASNYPNIRIFSVGTSTYSSSPLNELAKYDLGWSVASASSVGGNDWVYMSAVCWFFGKDLYNQYQIPIGLVSSNWGGTVIQAWSSPEALAACQQDSSSEKAEGRVGDQNSNSVLWNAMIVPFTPMAISGAIWYQGEQNVGQAELYACMEPAMITDWRKNFNTQFPFLFTQLAPWTAGTTFPAVADLRQAQLAGLTLPKVAYASAVDLGDASSPFGSIHPRDKQTVGSRLANAAREVAYGETGIIWQGPTFSSATSNILGTTLTVSVTFDLNGSENLVQVDTVCASGVPTSNCENWGLVVGSEYVTPNATAVSSADTVTLTFDNLQGSPSTLQYAYNIWPVTTIFNKQGLPAIPFQTTSF